MRKTLTWLLAGTLALLSSACTVMETQSLGKGSGFTANGDIPPQVVDWARTNVWKVHIGRGAGSGFAYDKDTVITACHVVRSTPKDQLLWLTNDRDTRVVFVQTKSCNEDTDIAVLKVRFGDDLNPSPTVLRQETRQGKVVWGAGHPLDMALVITQGHIQTPDDTDHALNGRFITSATIFGDSGSPVLAMYKGQVAVVGIRVSILAASVSLGFGSIPNLMPHLTLMSPAKNIQDEIESD